MERDENFYEGEPCIIEIEKRLNNVQKYLSEGNIKKAQGGIKGLWHAVTELAETARRTLERAEDEAVIVRDEIQKDDYWYSPYTAETAIDETISAIRDIAPLFETRAQEKHEETWAWETLKEAWSFAVKKTIKEWSKDYADRGEEGEKIARELFGGALTFFPSGAEIEYPIYNAPCLLFPTRSKEASNDLGASREYLEKYLGEYFGRAMSICEIPSYK